MKSKRFSSNVHGWVISSISKITFGGTHDGCIGDRSMPWTMADGNLWPTFTVIRAFSSVEVVY
jgi:hypothetical protein